MSRGRPKEEPREEVIIKSEPVVEEKKEEASDAKPADPKDKEEEKHANDKSSSWQKRKAKKEVPEDVLRKVLE